ncbi:hypothetical protein Hanom_Chr17g01530511 [Helianthus anomalus]
MYKSKTQGATFFCRKTPQIHEAHGSGQKAPQKNPKNLRLFGASCNYTRH